LIVISLAPREDLKQKEGIERCQTLQQQQQLLLLLIWKDRRFECTYVET